MKYLGNRSAESYISWVSSHYSSGLLLFDRVSSNYWGVITGEKNTACFGC
jgi:hypothetical protein